MLFSQLAATSAAVADTRSRKEKIRLIAETLHTAAADAPDAGLESETVAVVDTPPYELIALYLAGQVRQDRLDVGWRALSGDVPPAAGTPSLQVTDVDAAFAALAAAGGAGSRQSRRDILARLFARATTAEQHLLHGLILGELRQGALEGVVVQGVAAASGQDVADVQRALMLSGDLGETARIALTLGAEGLAAVTLEVFRPIQPMLAATAADVAEALDELASMARNKSMGPKGSTAPNRSMAMDYKLDGARIQVHRRGTEVRTFSRNLREVERPDVAAVVGEFSVHEVILDGEVIGVDDRGRPRPFQQTMSTFGSDELPAGTTLTPFFFDCLLVDGRDLLDAPLSVRRAALEEVVPAEHVVPTAVVQGVGEADAFFARAVSDGHEGVVCKALDAPYAAGRRGSAWRKVKPVHTLDLVILAVEWGSGRRRGWLSNLHLGARDPDGRVVDPGGFIMLGKTFKGLTDAMLEWQTARLQELSVASEGHIVHVRPELVVEIAFDGVQTSTRYPGGVALRFARVKRYRTDKDASQADTIDQVWSFRR